MAPPGPVLVQVGGQGRELNLQAGRIHMRLRPLTRPWRFDGLCVYDARSVTKADVALIALAGPIASITAGLVAWAVMSSLQLPSPLQSVFQIATLCSILAGVICLVPLKLQDSSGRTLKTDGAQALAAIARRL